jgi:hypothetical protein
MTVRELIVELEKLDPIAEIVSKYEGSRDGPPSFIRLRKLESDTAYFYEDEGPEYLFACPISKSGYNIKGTVWSNGKKKVVVLY